MKLFDYAVIHHPKKKDKDTETKASKLIVVPTTILAKDENTALMLAARAIPEEYVDKLDEVEVAVRPF